MNERRISSPWEPRATNTISALALLNLGRYLEPNRVSAHFVTAPTCSAGRFSKSKRCKIESLERSLGLNHRVVSYNIMAEDNSWVFDSLVCFLHGPVWNAPLQTFIEDKSISKDNDLFFSLCSDTKDCIEK